MADVRERLVSALAAGAILALFGYALIIGLTVAAPHSRPLVVETFDLTPPPPDHRVEPPVKPRHHDVAARKSSPGTMRRTASAAPRPNIQALSVVAVATVQAVIPPASGLDGRSGVGQGTGDGAGGSGDGNGNGNGDGDSDDGGQPPRLVRGRLDFSDLPEAMRAGWTDGTVGVRYDVESDGRVSACIPIASSGSDELDRLTCRLIRERFRFHPARDRAGRPVGATVEERHSWEIDRTEADGQPSSAQPPK